MSRCESRADQLHFLFTASTAFDPTQERVGSEEIQCGA